MATIESEKNLLSDGTDGTGVLPPITINEVNGRFLLYDVEAIMFVRKNWRMCGCLFGTLPQIPQQNVFLGLPLELMKEEVALLLENGVAVLADDQALHRTSIRQLSEADKANHLAQLEVEKEKAARAEALVAQEKKRKGLLKKKNVVDASSASTPPTPVSKVAKESSSLTEVKATVESSAAMEEDDTTLWSTAAAASKPADENKEKQSPATALVPVTPVLTSSAAGYTQLISPPPSTVFVADTNDARYNLYKYLHSLGYFLSPGLRFGCEFMAYPGDPLRFHSHFLVVSRLWEQNLSMMDLVGGGRLGTGVKKAWLLGGPGPQESETGDHEKAGNVRCFSIEWAGFG